MSVTIKASLYIDSWRGDPVEIRRFSVDGEAVKSYEFLVEQVAKVFPSVTAENITLAWIDGDRDTIVISSDDELAQALEYYNGNLFRLYIKKDSVPTAEDQKDDPGSINAGDPEQKGGLHPGVVCDGCNGPIYGSRFKCLVCSDYDLCTGCEGKGTHINHNMVEIERPVGFNPWANAFPGHPFGWHGTGFGGCRGQWARSPRGYPYRGHWGGRGRRGGCPSFPGQGRQCKPDRKPEEDRAAEPEPMDTEQKGGPGEEDRRQYLRRVGDAVSSFLEPLGIKVDVDVANRGSEGSKPAEASTTATSEEAVEIALAQLKSMGYEDEGGWLTELIRAKGGDVTKVLDALHPTSDEV